MDAVARQGREISEAEWAALRAHADPDETSDILLRYQRELLQTTALHTVVLCEKSRRTGMTWAAAADAVLTASAMREAGGMDVFYMGYNLDMAREFIDTCAMWAESFGEAMTEVGVEPYLFDDAGQPIQAFRVRFASGYEIRALAARPRSLRGLQGYLILDEAAFHDSLQQVIDAAVPFLMWGGKILVISTHFGEANAFNRMIEDARAGRKPYKVLRVTLDDALMDGLFRRICDKNGETWSAEAEARWRQNLIDNAGDAADEEFFCIPSQGGGAVLNGALIEARMTDGVPVLRLEKSTAFGLMPEAARRAETEQWCEAFLLPLLKVMDPHLPSFLGGDFGRVGDLTVYWPLVTARTLKRVTPFVVELRNIPFEQQWQIGRYICDRLPRFSAAKLDAIGIGAQLAETFAQRYGALRVEQVKLSATWYVENVPALRASFEDDGIAIPLDLDIKKDLQLPIMRGGVPTMPPLRVTGSDGKKRHGDAFVALLLAHAASRSNYTEYGYETLGSQAAGGPAPHWSEAQRAERDIMIGHRRDGLW
jgi:phage FluMu gp28-like protein